MVATITPKTEMVSTLRANVSVGCRRHDLPMDFIGDGNGGGHWQCPSGCDVFVVLNWKPAKVQNNGHGGTP
jgi:hypothetical protein